MGYIWQSIYRQTKCSDGEIGDLGMAKAKTKFDYEIEAFELAFNDKKELNIAIYGTGRMTATLLSRLKGFHIVGLLDRDATTIGQEMYGVRIISREEAERRADIVIINTSEAYWGTIYQRIQNWKMPVYFRNGERATKAFLHENGTELYWKKNYDELVNKIQNYEVVSFDVFDTLIMRKVYLPIDIFGIVERKFRDKLRNGFSFVEARKKVASILENATIDEIYDEMGKEEGWDRELKEKVKQYEIEVEKRMIIPRKDMVELCNTLKEAKEVFLISDMYFSNTVLEKILSECGVDIQRENILVSCDLKRSKEDGTLWEYYRDTKVKGRKAVHIGDNEKADGELPKQYGIDTYVVWSSNKILQGSSIGNIAPDINTPYTSFYVGILSEKMLNSPFALQRTNGKLVFTKEQDAGYCLLGSMVYIFCRWLLTQAKENKVRQLVFLAREGYLLSKLFRYYCQLTKEKDAPEIIYLETSRRAVLVASIQNKKNIYETSDFPYIGSVADFLQDRLGISVEDKALQTKDFGYTKENKQELQNILDKYEKEILWEADRERQNYLAYLDSVGLKSDFAIIDSQLYGTTQFYLGKLLDAKLRGYYFCVCMDKTNQYLKQNIMQGCFPGRTGLDGKDSSIYKNAAFIEAFFTAPNGMLEYIKDNGEKQYAEKKQNQINFDTRLEMMEGIQEYLKEAVTFCERYNVDIGSEDIYFTDKMFGLLMNNGFEPTDKMKHSFYYDNGIASRKEMPIWE